MCTLMSHIKHAQNITCTYINKGRSKPTIHSINQVITLGGHRSQTLEGEDNQEHLTEKLKNLSRKKCFIVPLHEETHSTDKVLLQLCEHNTVYKWTGTTTQFINSRLLIS